MNAGFVHQYSQLTRGRMHFVEAGTGRCAILLHGWPGLWFDYRSVLRRAAGIGRFIAPDFLGFGNSDFPSGDPVLAADEEAFATSTSALSVSVQSGPAAGRHIRSSG